MTSEPIPKYLAIAQGIRWQILSGEYGPGELLPLVEDLDQEWEATSSTVLRALGELERDDVVRRVPEGWAVPGMRGVQADLVIYDEVPPFDGEGSE